MPQDVSHLGSPTKPGPWNVERALIEPEFQDLWDGLIFAAPLWGTGNEQIEVVKNRMSHPSRSDAPLVTWKTGSHGIGFYTESGVSSGRLYWDIPERPVGAVEISVFAAVDFQPHQSNMAVIHFGADNFAVDYSLGIHSSGPNDWQFAGDRANNVGWNNSGYGTIGIARDPNGTRFIQDGQFIAEGTQSAGVLPGDEPDRIGLVGAQTDQNGTIGNIFVAYVWDRKLTDAELIRVHDDPFGMIRMRRRRAVPAGGGQTVAVTILAETDALVPAVPEKPIVTAVGVLGENDALIPAAPVKVADIGTLAEAGSLLPVQPRKIAVIGTLVETDTPEPIAADKPIIMDVGTIG